MQAFFVIKVLYSGTKIGETRNHQVWIYVTIISLSNFIITVSADRDSLVSIATLYGLGAKGIESRWEQLSQRIPLRPCTIGSGSLFR